MLLNAVGTPASPRPLGALPDPCVRADAVPDAPLRFDASGLPPRALRSDAPGGIDHAPRLPAPQSFSAADLLDLLRAIREKSQTLQADTLATGIASTKKEMADNTAVQLQKVQDWINDTVKSENLTGWQKFLSWMGKALSVIAAVAVVIASAAAIVASGGLAAPLVLVMGAALMSAANTVMSIVSEAAGGPPMTLGSLVSGLISKVLVALGVDEAQAEKIAKIVAGALAVVTVVAILAEPSLIGGMAQSIAEMAGASDEVAQYIAMAMTIAAGVAGVAFTMGASIAPALASTTAAVAAKVASTTAQVVRAADDVTQGSFGIVVAHQDLAVAQTQSERKKWEAMLLALDARMKQDTEQLEKVIREIDASATRFSQMLAGMADSIAWVTSNVGKRVTI